MNPARVEPDQSTYSGRLAKRIRELRDKAGITPDDMTARMERAGYPLTIHKLWHWESGRAKVDLDAIPALVAAFGLRSAHALVPKE